ncbi:MAG: UDP-N-acetylmuramate dehydrogenase [Roseiflexaceae bacterium]
MDNPDIIIADSVPLAALTSWRIGGVARHLATVSSVVGLQHALQFAEQHRLPIWILGGGSNILISDAGLNGVVIRMRDRHLHIVEASDYAHIHIGAGAQMAGTVRRLSKQGWHGLTWAEGLPGTVGGAVYGNAGCYGGEMAQSVTSVDIWHHGMVQTQPAPFFAFQYRTSAIKVHNAQFMRTGMPVADLGPIVVGATITLQRGDVATLAAAMDSTAALRRSKTPQGSSCGSVFKNPPGDSAGRLIDAAGLRGYTYGGAMVAEKHANYIVNHGHATSADVLHIMYHVRAQVDRIFGIQLEPEVQLLGDMTL